MASLRETREGSQYVELITSQLHRAIRDFGVQQTWLRWTDEDSEGEHQDFLSIPRRLHLENCSGLNNEDPTYVLLGLRYLLCPVILQTERNQMIWLYRLKQPTQSGRRMLAVGDNSVQTKDRLRAELDWRQSDMTKPRTRGGRLELPTGHLEAPGDCGDGQGVGLETRTAGGIRREELEECSG